MVIRVQLFIGIALVFILNEDDVVAESTNQTDAVNSDTTIDEQNIKLELSSTSLEPIYFGPSYLPDNEDEDSILPVQLSSIQEHQHNLPASSFYSLGADQLHENNFTNQPYKQQTNPTDELILRSFGLEESRDQLVRQYTGTTRSNQFSSQQRESFPDRKLESQQLSIKPIDKFSRLLLPIEQTFEPRREKQKLANENKLVQNKNHQPTRPIASASPINLSSLIEPGQVILSERSKAGSSSQVNKVSLQEIESLLNRLKPLALNYSELPESEKVDEQDNDDDDEQSEADAEAEEDGRSKIIGRKDMENMRKRKRLDLVLPTSHVFGGPGVLSESRLLARKNKPANKQSSYKELDDDTNTNELDFLKALANLGSSLDSNEAEGDQLIRLQNDHFYDPTLATTKNRKPKPKPKITEETLPIEIEDLVDHLMSSSRLATFGVQHGDVKQPKIGFIQQESEREVDANPMEEEEDDGDEEEDEEEDEDQDNNGTLPMEAQASTPVEVTVATDSMNLGSFFGPNKTNSWIPLDSIDLQTKPPAAKAKERSNNGEKRKRRRRRKKKKKRKKRKIKTLGLVIGDKVLSQNELIKLIGLLNKMASKKEESKEREASRKLLRFLIRLAFEEYKRSSSSSSSSSGDRTQQEVKKMKIDSKTTDDPIRELLRSILMSPGSDEGAGSEQADEEVIELRPYRSPEKDAEENDSKSKGRNLSSNWRDEQQQQQQLSGVRGNRLNKIADDLEQYFDSDFFEDLADNNRNGNNSQIQTKTASSYGQQIPAKKTRRESKYSLPVPIYGHQHLEAADEDDVDLDHIRLPASGEQINNDNSNNNNSKRRSRRNHRKEARTDGNNFLAGKEVARGKKSTKRRQIDKKTSDSDENDDGPEADADADKDERDEEEQEGTSRGTGAGSSKEERAATRRSPEAVRARRHKKVTREPEVEEEEEEPERENEQTAKDADQDVYYSNQDQGAGEKDKEKEEENHGKGRRRRRSRKKKRKLADRTETTTMDSFNRDEIPAPIMSAKLSPALDLKRLNATKTREGRSKINRIIKEPDKTISRTEDEHTDSLVTNNNSKERKLIEDDVQITKPRAQSGAQKDRKRRLARDRNRKEASAKRAERAKKKKKKNRRAKDDDDQDYYNEGTSYSKVCDDDDKCEVTVKSSSPNLSKAIEAQDESTITRHLDKISSEPGID